MMVLERGQRGPLHSGWQAPSDRRFAAEGRAETEDDVYQRKTKETRATYKHILALLKISDAIKNAEA